MKPEDIRALRTAYKMTREEFSRSIGITNQTLYLWEKGVHPPSRYDIVVLYKLWTMLHDPEEREIAKKALHKAKTLPSSPPTAKEGMGLGQIIKDGLKGFGLGLLLSSLFEGNKKIKKNLKC